MNNLVGVGKSFQYKKTSKKVCFRLVNIFENGINGYKSSKNFKFKTLSLRTSKN
jgi:hypothetical protein